MARPNSFSTVLFLSFVSRLVLGTEQPGTVFSTFEVVNGTSGLPVQVNPVFTDVAPYSANLPIPPVPFAAQRQPSHIFLEPRTYGTRGNYNVPRTGTAEMKQAARVEMEVIPPGMKRVWTSVKSELSWFHNQTEHDTILKLFKVIIDDDYSKFVEFESEFESVFGCKYVGFSKSERSVLGWLIAYGSINILSSMEGLNKYCVSDKMLEISMTHLVKYHPISHISSMINLINFFSWDIMPKDKNLFILVSRKGPVNESPSFPHENIAALFTHMKSVRIAHIAYISFIPQTNGNQLQNLINFLTQINQSILNTAATNASPERRQFASRMFKNAMQNFLHKCVANFDDIRYPATIFSLAHLFIEFDNWEGLRKLLNSHGGIALSNANGKTMLQTAIDLCSFNCAVKLAAINNEAIFRVNNGLQCPFVQALMTDHMGYFNEFLDFVTPEQNNIEFFDGAEIKYLNAATLAIIFDRVEMLRAIVKRLTELGASSSSINLRKSLDTAITIKEENYSRTNQDAPRTANLISNEIWAYLLNEVPDFDIDGYNGKLIMDLVVIDRNITAANLLLNKPGFQINSTIFTPLSGGNCVRFLRNDIEMLRLLVSRGLDINGTITRQKSFGGVEEVPILVQLLETAASSEQYPQILELPTITLQGAIAAREFARSRQYSLITKVLHEFITRIEAQIAQQA